MAQAEMQQGLPPKVKGDKDTMALMGLLPLFDGGRNIGISELLGQGHVEGAPSLMDMLMPGHQQSAPAAGLPAAPASAGDAAMAAPPQLAQAAPEAAPVGNDAMAALMAARTGRSAPAQPAGPDIRRSEMSGLRDAGVDPGKLASMFMNGRSGRG